MKKTRYFEQEVLKKRPYLRLEWIENVIAAPLRTNVQEDGHKRYWGYVPELKRMLRVVTLEDGAVHNAFPDRSFREE